MQKIFEIINRKIKSITILLIVLIVIAGIIFLGRINKVNLKSHEVLPTNIRSQEDCKEKRLGLDKFKCWESLLDSTLEENGIKEAFLVFDDLYKNEPQFASGCHGYTHRLGEVTYQLLIKGQNFDFPPQTAYCGYGFYHGLTELLIQTKGPEAAGKLCDSKKLSITKVLYDACYHGIGHGALSSTAKDKNIWGDPQKMIDFALNLCIESTDNQTERSRCASGIFMELAEDFNNGQLQLADIKDDPLSVCRKQQEFGKMDCYTQMNGVLNMIAGGKLKDSAKFVEAIEEDKYAIEAIITVAAPTINISKSNFSEDTNTCRSLQDRLHLPCIKGLVLAFLLKGQPGVEYEQAINFCKLSNLSEDEKESCFELLLRHSSEMYSPDTMKIICNQVASQHKKNYCPSNL